MTKQLKILTDTYRVEKRKTKGRSGMIVVEGYVPTLAWFHVADSFLAPHVAFRVGTDNNPVQNTTKKKMNEVSYLVLFI